MPSELTILLGTAATLGFVHTLLGPDHYVPFVAMARARDWSVRRTLGITLLSGAGHVLSSILIGAAGLIFGLEVLRLEALESLRGAVAGWLLLGFGLVYMVWGLRRAIRQSRFTHAHGPLTHTHLKAAHPGHDHDGRPGLTPWVIFTIFVFGPCEPLIPVLMYPAARADAFTVFAVALTFSLVTIGTMSVLVYASLKSLTRVRAHGLERWSHALAGFVVTLCGASIQFFGL